MAVLSHNSPRKVEPNVYKQEFDLFDIMHGVLYIHERPMTIWSEESEKAFDDAKRKRLGVDNTLKSF